MKKNSFLVVAFCFLCIATVMALYAEQIPISGYVTPDIGLNVREGPSESYTIIQALPQGTSMTISSVSGGWYKISSPISGYVSSQWVTVTEYGEAPEEEEDESSMTSDEVEKAGCDIEKSLKNAKVTKAPPKKL